MTVTIFWFLFLTLEEFKSIVRIGTISFFSFSGILVVKLEDHLHSLYNLGIYLPTYLCTPHR
jgi:hypothetical protein